MRASGDSNHHLPPGGGGGTSSSPGGGGGGGVSSSFTSSVSMAFRSRRSYLSIRRGIQIVSMENSQEQELEEIALFQTHVAQRLQALTVAAVDQTHSLHPLQEEPEDSGGPEQRENKKKGGEGEEEEFVLSVAFLRKLLEALLSCEEEFRTLLLARPPAAAPSSPVVDRLVADLLERCVKSLDICNAVSQSLDSLRHLQKHAEIAAAALLGRLGPSAVPPGDAQFSRARNAIGKLLAAISPIERPAAVCGERAWTFGRSSRWGSTAGSNPSDNPVNRYTQRSLSLKVSRNWSAAKQLQAMAGNLSPPRGGEGGALAMAVYTMNALLTFSMYVLVAAFPSQDRQQAPAFPAPPRQLPWAMAMTGLQERMWEEWRRKERKAGSLMPAGMLAELQRLERAGKGLLELGGGLSFPVDEEQAEEIAAQAREMAETCRGLAEEVEPLQRQVREAFRRIVRGRAEVAEFVAQGSRGTGSSSAAAAPTL